MLRFLTPNDALTLTTGKRVLIPANDAWLSLILGALLPLTRPSHWEQFGILTPDEAAQQANDWFVRMIMDTGIIGTILPYATVNPPEGCLRCDGGNYLRQDYPDLFALLDLPFIDNADEFHTPDLRGRMIMSDGNGSGLTNRNAGEFGGEEEHQLDISEMPNHFHQINAFAEPLRSGAATLHDFWYTSIVGSVQTESVGADMAHNNMPPYFALKFCIVAK